MLHKEVPQEDKPVHWQSLHIESILVNFLTKEYKDFVAIEHGSARNFGTPSKEQFQVVGYRWIREQVVQLLEWLLGQLSLGWNQELF